MREFVIGSLLSGAVAFGSIFLTHVSQTTQWENAQRLAELKRTLDTRTEILTEMASVFAESQRFAFYQRSLPQQQSLEFVRIAACVSPEPTNEDACRITTWDAKVFEQLAEFSKLYARYETVKTRAQVYFCSETAVAIEKMPRGAFWWNAQADVRNKLLDSMRTELACAKESQREP